jgi:hypothetical protein
MSPGSVNKKLSIDSQQSRVTMWLRVVCQVEGVSGGFDTSL